MIVKIDPRSVIFVALLLAFPAFLPAQQTPEERDAYLEGYLSTLAKDVSPEPKEEAFTPQPAVPKPAPIPVTEERNSVMERVLRNIHIELVTEGMPVVKGKQIFEVVNSSNKRISRLTYPLKGQFWFAKGELRLLPILSFGGRYGNSNFRRSSSTDTDWLPTISPMVWNESISDTNIKLEIYDINMYLRLLNFDRSTPGENSKYLAVLDNWMVDKLSFDILGGYQKQKGRYKTYNLVDQVEDWGDVHVFIPGDASFYKIKYYGPRAGFRAEGSRGRLSTSLSFAYAWLKTDAFGWWNLRRYHFWQKGKNGYGLELTADVTYRITPHWSAGLGFNYFQLRQKSLSETGVYETDPGDNYKNLDIIRKANFDMYGPSVILKYVW